MPQNEKINEGNWLAGLARSAKNAVKNSSIASGIQSITGDSNQTKAEIVFKKRFMKRFISNIDSILKSAEKSHVNESLESMLEQELGEAARVVRDERSLYPGKRVNTKSVKDQPSFQPERQAQPAFNKQKPPNTSTKQSASELISEIKKQYPNWNSNRYNEYARRVLHFANKPNITHTELAKKKSAIASQLDSAFSYEHPAPGADSKKTDEPQHSDTTSTSNPYVEAVYDAVKHVWLPGIKVNDENLLKIAKLFSAGRKSKGYQSSLVKLANLVWVAANTGVSDTSSHQVKKQDAGKQDSRSSYNGEPASNSSAQIKQFINTLPVNKIEDVQEITETGVRRLLKLQNNNKELVKEFLKDMIRRLN